MKYRNKLKYSADTYFFAISKAVLFIASLMASGVLYLVHSMISSPEIVYKYYFAVPGMVKDLLLICSAVAVVGALMEIGTN